MATVYHTLNIFFLVGECKRLKKKMQVQNPKYREGSSRHEIMSPGRAAVTTVKFYLRWKEIKGN